MKISERADIDKAEKILAELEAHPMTRKLREDREAEILQVREEAAERLARSKEEAARVLPGLQAAEDAAREAVKAHDGRRRELEAAIARAAAARAEERLRIEREQAAAERILLENYSEKIDEAILFFRDKLDELRKPGKIDRRGRGAERNIFTWKVKTTEESNVQAINSAMAYCRAALVELEQVKLLPELDAEKIAALKAGIPTIDVYTEYGGEKPIGPTSADVDPRMALKSDSQIEWEIGKLNQKFKELMGR